MGITTELYRHSLALLTDQYELTMAQGYFQAGMVETEAAFCLFYRRNPFGGGYAVACGLAFAVDFVRDLAFDDGDLAFLAAQRGNDGERLFETAFLDYLRSLRPAVDIDAMPEGTVAFPQEPLLRVAGPIAQCQILESALLNLLNFQTLIATKAARVCQAARGDPVLEFGLRRAQGIDGALAASRAAFVGGCAATSNVLAGKLFDIPVRGTHAHSWVMAFDDELEAFDAYARAMPNNCLFLVDTYDTLAGVRRAVEIGRRLRERGHEMAGVRLDSGDLAYLSIEARKILDEAGFHHAVIVGSNNLDEHVIASLKDQGATIGVWGVGTRLATGHDEPALGGVYKLTAVRKPGRNWQDTIKLSEQAVKITAPGLQQVRRFATESEYVADMIFDEARPPAEDPTIVDPLDPTRRKVLPEGAAGEDLLVPVFRGGRCVYEAPPPAEARRRAADQLARFHPGVKRFVNPHQYPVGLEEGLYERKTRLILEARQAAGRR